MSREKKTPLSSDTTPMTCPECQGRGWIDNRCLTTDQQHRCAACQGRGSSAAGKQCTACHGTGLLDVRQEDKSPCALCTGAGVYPIPESMILSDFAYRPRRRKS
jgi:hypothetical protein